MCGQHNMYRAFVAAGAAYDSLNLSFLHYITCEGLAPLPWDQCNIVSAFAITVRKAGGFLRNRDFGWCKRSQDNVIESLVPCHSAWHGGTRCPPVTLNLTFLDYPIHCDNCVLWLCSAVSALVLVYTAYCALQIVLLTLHNNICAAQTPRPNRKATATWSWTVSSSRRRPHEAIDSVASQSPLCLAAAARNDAFCHGSLLLHSTEARSTSRLRLSQADCLWDWSLLLLLLLLLPEWQQKSPH